MGVEVGIGVSVFDGVMDGIGVEVRLGVNVEAGTRVFVALVEVAEIKRIGVPLEVAVMVIVSVGDGVGVMMYSEIPSTVSAATVLMLEKAESTIFCGSIAETLGPPGLASAAAATMQNKLNPSVPVANTVKGPLYSRILTPSSSRKRHRYNAEKYSTAKNDLFRRL